MADITSVISPQDSQALADAGHISPALNDHIQGLHAQGGFDLAKSVMDTAGASPPSKASLDAAAAPTAADVAAAGNITYQDPGSNAPAYLSRASQNASLNNAPPPGAATPPAAGATIPKAAGGPAKPAGPNSNTMAMDLANKRADITGGGLDKQAEALKAEQAAKDEAVGKVADATTEANDVYSQQLQQDEDARTAAFNENKTWHDQHQAQLQQAMGQGVDPNKFWADKNAGGTVMTGLALALGALGAGATGQNMAVPVVQKGIDDSIKAQEVNIDKNLKVLQMSGADQAEKEAAQAKLLAEKANIKAKAYTTALAQVNVMAQKANIPADDARLQGIVGTLNSQRDMALTAPTELKVAQRKAQERAAAAAAAKAEAKSEENRKFNRGLSADLIKADNAAANKAAGATGKTPRTLIKSLASADQAEAALGDLKKIMGSGVNIAAPLIPTKYKEERDASLDRAAQHLAAVTGESPEHIREKLNAVGDTTRSAHMNDYMAQIATLRNSAKSIKEGGTGGGSANGEAE